MATGGQVHPLCMNSGNPYHECSDYCYRMIAERRAAGEVSASEPGRGFDEDGDATLPTSFGRPSKRPRSEEAEGDRQPGVLPDSGGPGSPEVDANGAGQEDEPGNCGGDGEAGVREDGDDLVDPTAQMNPREKRLFELRLKMNAARKANHSAVVTEKQREEAPKESHGVSRKKWYEEKQKRVAQQLEGSGLDTGQRYMLDTQEEAETKYKKWEKNPAPFGWDVFNQMSLYKAYKKRTKDIPYTQEEYEQAKAADPSAGLSDSGLLYGQTGAVAEENIDKMVGELEARAKKRKEFSRRRKFYDEKDTDSINERNAHFNRKIERAFGKYTVEIKNNLERGTALPD